MSMFFKSDVFDHHIVRELKEKSLPSTISTFLMGAVYFSYCATQSAPFTWLSYTLFILLLTTISIRGYLYKSDLSPKVFRLVHTTNIFFNSLTWSFVFNHFVAINHQDPFLISVSTVIIASMHASAIFSLSVSKIDFFLFQLNILAGTTYLFFSLGKGPFDTLMSLFLMSFFFGFLFVQRNNYFKNWKLLKDNNLELQTIIDTFPGGLSILKDDIYVRTNKYLKTNILGKVSNVKGRNIFEIGLDPKFAHEYASFKHSELLNYSFETIIATPNGQKEHIIFFNRSEHTEKSPIIVTSLDIHELKRTQKELEKQKTVLQEREKLASLGEMAAGIAHEINNPLAIISSKNEVILLKLKKLTSLEIVDKLKPDVDVVTQTIKRIATIIKSLKSFSQNTENEDFAKVNLKDLVRDTMAFCQDRFKTHQILFDVYFDDRSLNKDFMIECRPVQLSQVILNALNNSFDAIKTLNTRWIRMSLIKGSETLEIQITDSGAGIPEELRPKIMEAFVTTKSSTGGTGLGLSISQRIIHMHNGKIFFDFDRPNTCLKIIIPNSQSEFYAKIPKAS